jgi:hypothetical protein
MPNHFLLAAVALLLLASTVAAAPLPSEDTEAGSQAALNCLQSLPTQALPKRSLKEKTTWRWTLKKTWTLTVGQHATAEHSP